MNTLSDVSTCRSGPTKARLWRECAPLCSDASSSLKSIVNSKSTQERWLHIDLQITKKSVQEQYFRHGRSITRPGKSRKIKKISREQSKMKSNQSVLTTAKKLKCWEQDWRMLINKLQLGMLIKLACKKTLRKLLWEAYVPWTSKRWIS